MVISKITFSDLPINTHLMDNKPNPFPCWLLSPAGSELTLLHQEPAPRTLDEACQRLPGGAYTTLRTYRRLYTLRLESHFQRLEEAAALVGRAIALNRPSLRRALRAAVLATEPGETPDQEFRIRIILDLELQPGDVYIVRSRQQVPPPEAYQHGAAAITTSLQRDLPAAKLTAFIQRASVVHLPPGINEALMVDPAGRILEGLSSNFYAVIDEKLWTAGQGVLEGITRRLVLEEAAAAGLEIHLEAPTVADIPRFQEAFITSTSRAVLPITQIDGQPVGSGKVGPIARQLLELYQKRIQEELDFI
jgi:branched-chain amino acid aminotransferase